jgi:hypothetical protein
MKNFIPFIRLQTKRKILSRRHPKHILNTFPFSSSLRGMRICKIFRNTPKSALSNKSALCIRLHQLWNNYSFNWIGKKWFIYNSKSGWQGTVNPFLFLGWNKTESLGTYDVNNLLNQSRMLDKRNSAFLWNENWQGKPIEILREIKPQCYFVRHKSHKNWLGIQSWQLQWVTI